MPALQETFGPQRQNPYLQMQIGVSEFN
ncbi:hypothetical protein EDF85_5003, partial [Pseudomonas putida]